MLCFGQQYQAANHRHMLLIFSWRVCFAFGDISQKKDAHPKPSRGLQPGIPSNFRQWLNEFVFLRDLDQGHISASCRQQEKASGFIFGRPHKSQQRP
ncbi:hypothetical protein ElyMa_000641400 [Elysia marginata]|uniref:Secreted protein n=1 Tax=Elysia marginata TaxID=1093978 RepID=A0AAV4GCQ5_9GAST|nr:hypothetical protein ElyMa_000641400 [Elysia marginata]